MTPSSVKDQPIDLTALEVRIISEDTYEIIDRSCAKGILKLSIRFRSYDGKSLTKTDIIWTIPAYNVKGVWSSDLLYEKRIRADWEGHKLQSRISTDAPLIAIFDHSDCNIMTAAIDDLVHRVSIEAPVREEDNLVYFKFTLFEENQDSIDQTIDLRINTRSDHFAAVLQDYARWWEDGRERILPPIASAFEPVYSTWYAYHQNLNEAELLEECRVSAQLGYKVIILDDGWQTMDDNRGYDYTGDWQPERFDNMAGFVRNVHDTGMKIMLWYSVPFCGKYSKAYQKFKGKFLTENHRWAPVFDPRYPEVRRHLIGLYINALQDWNIDGFKLDFIDDFKMYPESAVGRGNGRDYANVEKAIERLLRDAIAAMLEVKSDLLIEFRQNYISPALRQFANMFRAFDCPNDAVSNRLRTTDVKLLCGSSAVHSDMITWPTDEKAEVAALQMASILFSVPQISVRMNEVSKECKAMIGFYTAFWIEHRELLMHGDFKPIGPMSNYPVLRSRKGSKEIIGVYDNHVIQLTDATEIYLVNGKTSTSITLTKSKDSPLSTLLVKDCLGRIVSDGQLDVYSTLEMIEVPQCGIVELK